MSSMSLFRKPRRRPPALKGQKEDDDGHDDDEVQRHREAPVPKEAVPKRPRPLLSFADEVEDESDAFRVKKSSHSKKLQRRKHRQAEAERPERPERPEPVRRDQDEDEPKNSRKNDTYTKPRASMEGLVLSGRAALAAGSTDDIDSEDERDEDGDENRAPFRPMYRNKTDPVRAMLDLGVIPDAATIHAARKKRQRAREIGDFIPVQQNSSESSKTNFHSTISNNGRNEGRLVREDGAGDASDEDPDRIDVRGVAPETTRKERIQLAKEEGPDSDADSGGEEWETQQIRKAVTQNQIIAVQQESYYGTNYVPTPIKFPEAEMNLFTMNHANVGISSIMSPHLQPLATTDGTLSINQLTEILQQRLNGLLETKQKKNNEISLMEKELIKLKEIRESSTKKAPTLASRYEFYQKLRGYLTDLIECLDEKMPILNALEARAMTLHKRKAAFLCERRRNDVRDQAHDVLQTAGGAAKKDPVDEERRRRCAEREGRRLRRRRIREQQSEGKSLIPHRDGDSSDDEVPQTESAAYETTEEQILTDAESLFADTLEEFSSLAAVLSHLEEWKNKDHTSYVDAYVSVCLPRLAGPFLRLKLLLWNPIADEGAPDWDKMQWYRGLMLYSLSEDAGKLETEPLLAADPDICLIPNIVQKVILPKLADLVEGTWDPMSHSQTRRLAMLMKRAGTMPGASSNNRHFNNLATAVLNRIKTALQHDVFIPILPKSLVDTGPRSGSAFLKRQSAAGVRLFNNLLQLQGTLADTALAPLALEALLQRYLLAAIRCSPPAFAAELCTSIATSLPKVWIGQEYSQAPLQQFLICCQEILDCLADNVMNLKPLEEIRTAISILQPISTNKK